MSKRATKAAPPPVVPCPRCGLPAPRFCVGVGRDLHECSCGSYLERWHCCGAVAESFPGTGYRANGTCPKCGESRWRAPAEYHETTGDRVYGGAAES